MHAPRSFVVLSLLACSLLLTACDLLGLEPASAMAARKEAEGRAIGGACRHAGRAIEDCYTLNRRADKAAVFSGWREMNDYMRENKLESVAPEIPTPAYLAARAAEQAASGGADGGEPAEEAAPKASPKAAGKPADKGKAGTKH
ncbi:MAG: hypothetical protein ACOVOG_15065 [Rubrivivax sp.]|nr:hypothetical protein [Rubrivivax sp.]